MGSLGRRKLLGTGALALAAVSTRRVGMSEPEPRSNILFLMTDQHRGDTLGVAGHPGIARRAVQLVD